MTAPMGFAAVGRRLGAIWSAGMLAGAGLRCRLRISAVALTWLAIGSVVLTALLVTLGKVTEDVVAGNGWQTTDLAEVEAVGSQRSAIGVSLALLLARIGSLPVLLAVGLLAGAVLWWRRERLFVVLAPTAALLLTGLAIAVGKHVVARARPPLTLRLVTADNASFPSGHAGDSAAMLVTLVVLTTALIAGRWLLRAALVAGGVTLATAIGASRIVLGVHYPTDVLAGLTLGAAIGLVIAAATLIARSRLTHAPR